MPKPSRTIFLLNLKNSLFVIQKLIGSSREREKNYCFRCGDFNHVAKLCQDPIRCFVCGVFGHKRKDCLLKSASSEFSSPSINHGFQLILKFLKLKGLLLDYQWFMRDIGINYLKELYHFDIVNEPNIGKGYKEKFGNPEDFFGKTELCR